MAHKEYGVTDNRVAPYLSHLYLNKISPEFIDFRYISEVVLNC